MVFIKSHECQCISMCKSRAKTDFYTWLTLGLVAGTLLQLQQQQKPWARLPKGLWERLFRCTKKNNLLFAWPIKLAFIWALLHQATKMMDSSIWWKCLLTKNIHMVCFFPNEVGTEVETEVSFIAPALRSYSWPRQLLILKMLYFVFWGTFPSLLLHLCNLLMLLSVCKNHAFI